jgi:hypothetical protein
MVNWEIRIIESGIEDPAQLLANPRNHRIHSALQQQGMQGVLESIGWIDRIKVNQRTGFVLNGHMRVAVAISNHQKSVPVDYLDLNEEEELLALTFYDELERMAGVDRKMLQQNIEDSQTRNNKVLGLLEEIKRRNEFMLENAQKRITEQMARQGQMMQNAEDKAGQSTTIPGLSLSATDACQPGDIFSIHSLRLPNREHYIVCADSTQDENCWLAAGFDVEPKLGVSVVTDTTGLYNITRHWDKALPCYYFWCSLDLMGDVVGEMKDHGYKLESMLVWPKAKPASEGRFYRTQYETCLFLVKDGVDVPWYGSRKESDVWQIDPNGECGESRPMECMQKPMGFHTLPGECVYDPFLHDGTTILAAEQFGRLCVGFEKDPEKVKAVLSMCERLGFKWLRV